MSSWDVFAPKRLEAARSAQLAEDTLEARYRRIKMRSFALAANAAPDPVFGSKEYQIKMNATKSARRLKERYRFRSKRNTLSMEIDLMYKQRYLHFPTLT